MTLIIISSKSLTSTRSSKERSQMTTTRSSRTSDITLNNPKIWRKESALSFKNSFTTSSETTFCKGRSRWWVVSNSREKSWWLSSLSNLLWCSWNTVRKYFPNYRRLIHTFSWPTIVIVCIQRTTIRNNNAVARIIILWSILATEELKLCLIVKNYKLWTCDLILL